MIRRLGCREGMARYWLARRADGVFKGGGPEVPTHSRARRDMEQRFARERILAGCGAPHIARIYDAGVDPKRPAITCRWNTCKAKTAHPDWCDAQRWVFDERRMCSDR